MSVRFVSDKERLINAGGKETSSPNGLCHWIDMPRARFMDDSPAEIFCDHNGDILTARNPDIDRGLITRITAYQDVFLAKRRLGEYRCGSAYGVVRKQEGGRYNYHIQYVGVTLEDIQELHRLICAGQIWPVVDNESEQVPPPCRHLRQLAREAWAIIRRDIHNRLREWNEGR